MGNSSSDNNKNKDTKKSSNKGKGTKKKGDKKNNEGGGDGFFGPFKWRVFVIGVLLIIFAALQLPFTSEYIDNVSDLKDSCHNTCDFFLIGTLKDECDDECNDQFSPQLAALSFMEIGLLCMLIGSACAIVINFLNCNDCCGNIGMLCIYLSHI